MPVLDIGPGWAVMMAVFFYINPLDCALPFCLAALVHEAGHFLALLALRVPILRFRLRLSGASLETGPMRFEDELLCALAGPFANLTLLLLGPLWPRLSALSLLLACFNLLPFPAFDGGRALRAALSLHFSDRTVCAVTKTVSVIFAVGIAGFSLWAGTALRGGVWPVLTAGLILLRVGLDIFKNPYD